MISELIRYARENKIGSGLWWSTVPATVVDLKTGQTREEPNLPCYRRKRSGTRAWAKPYLFLEKTWIFHGRFNPKPTENHEDAKKAFIQAMRQLAPQSVLAAKIVQYLNDGGTIPRESDDDWISFEYEGLNLKTDENLRGIVDRYIEREDNENELADHGTCMECGKHGALIDLHPSLPMLDREDPILISFSRKQYGDRRGGENYPLCPSCSRLYTNAINVLCERYGQPIGKGRTIIPLFDDGIVLAWSKSSAWVDQIIPGMGPDLIAGVPYRDLLRVGKNVDTLLELIKFNKTEGIVNMKSPDLSCPGAACGALFAQIDRASFGAGLSTPDLPAALANPRRVFITFLPRLWQALALKNDESVPLWFKSEIKAAVDNLHKFPTSLTEEQKGNFLIALYKSPAKRYGAQQGYCMPTRYAQNLADALAERGVSTELEYPVWQDLNEPEPTERPPLRKIEKGWYRIDIAIPETRIAIEVDGGGRDYDQDREREYVLIRRGWQVLRVTNGNLSTTEGLELWADRFAQIVQNVKNQSLI